MTHDFTPLNLTDLDRKAIDTARLLAADAVQNAGHGHPGTAMSLAPVAYLLYQRVMRLDPNDSQWIGRDRFVLSAGHSSLTQYVQLYFSGFGLELDDIKDLRKWGSKTPGHPEYGHTAGVEVTTGPLGQGLANAVGMAMSARRLRGLLDPDSPADESPFDHHMWVIAGDGDVSEGVTGEASSLAGTQKLGNLTVIWDDNRISIEDDTSIAFTEDVAARYEAYGWHVQTVDWTNGGKTYTENLDALYAALMESKSVTDRPSFIQLRTIIAWPAPTKQNTGAAHGSALGADEIKATKEILGFDPEIAFNVSDEVIAHTRLAKERGASIRKEWNESFANWQKANPGGAELLDRLLKRQLPAELSAALPSFPAGEDVATRVASGNVLSAIAGLLPELWGGSADLAGSNNTSPKGEISFLPPDRSSKAITGDWYGRVLHFGVREHAMAAILNGIALHGPTRPYGGTFLVFSDYMRPAVRLSALMELPVVYIWSHDSIGLGEDGPTHQPVEHISSLRAIPGLDVVRPADANETVAAWEQILQNNAGPSALLLSRQNLPVFPRGEQGFATTQNVARGGYVLRDTAEELKVVIVATGSEVQLALAAQDALAKDGIGARVVSMPCLEWFEKQDRTYQDEVIPPQVRARVSIEAGIGQGWRDVVGDAGEIISLEHYGASGAYSKLFEEFGFTVDAIVAAATKSIGTANKIGGGAVRFHPRFSGPFGPNSNPNAPGK